MARLKDESFEASDNLPDLSSLQQKIPAVTKNNFHDSQFVVLSVTSDMLYSSFTPRKRFRYFQDTCPEPGAAQ
jgi:hypothetical protein